MKNNGMSRRQFLQVSASVAALLGLPGCAGLTFDRWGRIRKPRPIGPNDTIRVAQIGFNGAGRVDINGLAEQENVEVVALCDVDWGLENVIEVGDKFSEARRFEDYREMLLAMDDSIDAVSIAVPDHMHFLPAYMAISMAKHVYVQKPLTQTVAEARMLREAANRHEVQTIMGNQGHANEGTRLVREWVQGGVIGPVHEVQIWSNRPAGMWPQGTGKPPQTEPMPKDLRWNLFLGRAEEQPYSPEVHPFRWRGWWDFGTGSLGDMGCHLMDASFWALDLDAPISVEAETSELDPYSYPAWSIITYQFPARGKMPPVKLTWYDGGKSPERPERLEAGREFKEQGQLIIGEKSTIMDTGDYCESPRLIPESDMQAADLPEKSIPRIPKSSPYIELIRAIREGIPAGSNFNYAARLTEMVLLGNLAIRAQGQKIVWNDRKMQVENLPQLNAYLQPTYREGWLPKALA